MTICFIQHFLSPSVCVGVTCVLRACGVQSIPWIDALYLLPSLSTSPVWPPGFVTPAPISCACVPYLVTCVFQAVHWSLATAVPGYWLVAGTLLVAKAILGVPHFFSVWDLYYTTQPYVPLFARGLHLLCYSPLQHRIPPNMYEL